MKLRIFEEQKEEREIFLRLVESCGGGINLCAVNSTGDVLRGGHLLKFREDGRVCRMYNVSGNLGLPLDGDNRIKFVGEEE